MKERASEAGRKLIAFLVLVVAAYVIFKVVLGVVSTIVWIAVVITALLAVVWAVRTL